MIRAIFRSLYSRKVLFIRGARRLGTFHGRFSSGPAGRHFPWPVRRRRKAGATPDRARVPLTTDWTSHAELRPPFAISLASESRPNLASRARRARRRNAKKARCLEQRAFLSDQTTNATSAIERRLTICRLTISAIEGHLMILVTRPEPTVRPPSRMAKPRPSSMAIGWMSSTVISVLSPGMTISVPSGRVMIPVTSVVRK